MKRVVIGADRATVILERHPHMAELGKDFYAFDPTGARGEQELVLPGGQIIASNASGIIRESCTYFLDDAKIPSLRRRIDLTQPVCDLLIFRVFGGNARRHQ